MSRLELHHGDSLEFLRGLPDASVSAVVTDPPYELGFVGIEREVEYMDIARARLQSICSPTCRKD